VNEPMSIDITPKTEVAGVDEQLAEYAKSLVIQRDAAIAAARAATSDRWRHVKNGQADAFCLALSMLHTWTDGRFGQALKDQPDDDGVVGSGLSGHGVESGSA
jgi:acyl-CoA reductase-like NAD-dependent aldehyde dehydrogenase